MKNRKIKIILAAVLLGFLALLIYQNKAFFMTGHAFSINLLLLKYETPMISNTALMAAFFLFGFIAAYAISLKYRFNANNTINRLERELNEKSSFGSDTPVTNETASKNTEQERKASEMKNSEGEGTA